MVQLTLLNSVPSRAYTQNINGTVRAKNCKLTFKPDSKFWRSIFS